MRIEKTKIITNLNRPNGMVSKEIMENLGFELKEGFNKTGVMIHHGLIVDVYNKTQFKFVDEASWEETKNKLEKVKEKMCNKCYKRIMDKEQKAKYGTYGEKINDSCVICKFKEETKQSFELKEDEKGNGYFEYKAFVKKDMLSKEIKNVEKQFKKMEIFLKKRKKREIVVGDLENNLRTFALSFGFEFEEEGRLIFHQMSLKDSLYIQVLKQKIKREENKQLQFEVEFQSVNEEEKGFEIWLKVNLIKKEFKE